MNYVRKLGFEETPDYDFLRELFTKVLKTLNEPEDGVFDWMLLNNGKGWEAGHVSIHVYDFSFVYLRIPFRRHQLSLLKLMPMRPHRIHHTVHGTTVTPTAVQDNRSNSLRHPDLRWSLRPHLHTSRVAVVEQSGASHVVGQGSTSVFNHWHLQAGVQANSEISETMQAACKHHTHMRLRRLAQATLVSARTRMAEPHRYVLIAARAITNNSMVMARGRLRLVVRKIIRRNHFCTAGRHSQVRMVWRRGTVWVVR